jgi:hypothetical protein
MLAMLRPRWGTLKVIRLGLVIYGYRGENDFNKGLVSVIPVRVETRPQINYPHSRMGSFD